MRYNWQQPDWPEFRYDTAEVEEMLFDFAQRAGRTSGLLEGLSQEIKSEAIIEMMIAEAIKTSEIEGEYLSRKDVMSSIRRNLGLQDGGQVSDLRARGAADLMANVRDTYAAPLTEDMLFSWHKMIMLGSKGINTGQWRTHSEPMQIISGAIGREKVHFEAPSSNRVPEEMKRFIKWFNETAPKTKADMNKSPIRSAIAHLYFESIHPFEDGNGRIGRAISEKALSQGLGYPALLSLSKSIEANKADYYKGLMATQGSNEITEWLVYFVGTIVSAQQEAEAQISFSLQKTKFFDHYKGQFNERQEKVISRMLEEGEGGFKGGMSAKKYMSITKTSKATATRDLQELVTIKAFMPIGSGRSTHYDVNLGVKAH
ncbi:Fic family protein [uncultured Roseivirga sp.]|uniref:Fic family protein n=1 Tax=uncultured Roseivirga sp. TaxID=543088 RepID=UPI0030DD67A5|tara:strand:+ start:326079 stop:327194 length:1116 start_codon:yes stop_codon:yes gene_type:complete